MKRPSIAKQIADLQIEWATHYANQSLRTFLINTKSFTDRQYRYIMSKAPAQQWEVRKGEIQNRVAAETIETYAKEAALVHRGFIVAAQVATNVVHKRLAKGGLEMSSSDLLNLIKSLGEAQDVYCNAMGIEKGEGLVQSFIKNKSEDPAPARSSAAAVIDLSYEDTMALIEIKREMKAKRQTQNA